MGRLFAVLLVVVPVAFGGPEAAAEDQQQARTAAPAKSRTVTGQLARRHLARSKPDPAKQTLEDVLAEDLRAIWGGRPLRRGTTAMYVVDAKSGAPLFAVHEDRGLNPASNVKLVSTATALDLLGPDWRYATQLLGPQPNADGVIEGDLYLYGNADPTLRAKHLQAFAAELFAAGVRKLDGSVLAGDEPLRDSLGRSRVTIRVTGTAAGKAPVVEISPPNDLVQVELKAKTAKRKRKPRLTVKGTMVDDDQGVRYAVTINGAVRPGRTRKYHRKIPRASLYTAHVLRGALIEAGIEVTGDAHLAELGDYVSAGVQAGFLPVELARHESIPLSKLVRRINKPSNNFLADRLLMTVGAVRFGGEPTLEKGVAAMDEWLANTGIDPEACVLDTGSGLSYKSRLSSKQIVTIIRTATGLIEDDSDVPLPVGADIASFGGGIKGSFSVGIDMDQSPVMSGSTGTELDRVFHDSLAVAGVDGTLRRRYKSSPLAGRFIGKTGTLTSVIALSGLVSIGEHDTVAFAFMTNGHVHRRRNTVRFEHRKAAEAILDYLEARKRRRAKAEAKAAATTAAIPRPPAGQPASTESTRPPE